MISAFILPLFGAVYIITWFAFRPWQPSSSPIDLPEECARNLEKAETGSYRTKLIMLAVGVLFVPLVALYYWTRCCTNSVRGFFLCFRAMSLAFGISPIWPLLLSGIALFIAAFFHLKRFASVSTQYPILSTAVIDEAFGGQFRRWTCTLNRYLLNPVSYSRQDIGTAGLVAASLGGLATLLLVPAEDLRSLEPRSFEYILLGILLLLIAVTGFTFVQFAFSWSKVHAFLAALNSSVLGQFFTRLPDFVGNEPVWFRHVPLLSLAASVNSAIALHNLELTTPFGREYGKEYWNALRTFMNPEILIPTRGEGLPPELLDKYRKDRRQFVRNYRQFRTLSADISKKLTEQVIHPYWKEHPLPFVEPNPNDPGKPEKETGIEPPPAAHPEPKAEPLCCIPPEYAEQPNSISEESTSEEAYRLAIKYVTLQYTAFIGYVLRHLQNLLLCSVLGFILVVMALNSYSFQAPQIITRFLIFGLIIGGIIAICSLAQMERDPILSRLSGTTPGELGKDFYIRIIGYGALPILTVLSTQFPSVSQFFLSWLQPTLESIH